MTMADETKQAEKIHPKPGSGWKDGGSVWTNDKSAYGMRYKCKSCGKQGAGGGYASDLRSHYDDCSLAAPHRAEQAAQDAKRHKEADAIRVNLGAFDWTTLDDAAIRRIASLVFPKAEATS
jgi:hypothetical protein